MKNLTLIGAALVVASVFCPSSPIASSEVKFAQTKQSKPAPEELIEEGMKMIIDALDILLKTIPQYEAPEILENGDIIIRRSKPKPEMRNKLPDRDKT